LLGKRILTTIGTRKDTEKSWSHFKAQQLNPMKDKGRHVWYTVTFKFRYLNSHISSNNYFPAHNFHIITPNLSYSKIQRFHKDI
jgi:hypothetical protein